MTLDQVTAQSFEAQLESGFALSLDEGQAPVANLVLIEVTLSKHVPDAGRTPFSLVFEAPADPALPQGTYWLRHPVLGSLPIFIVPISGDSQTRRYQAVFS